MKDSEIHFPLPKDDADTIEKAIQKIRYAQIEHVYFFKKGRQLRRFVGTATEVNPHPSYLHEMKDCIVIHNHPSGSSFSQEDVEIVITYNAKELRVVTDKYIYRLVRPIEGWNIDFSEEHIKKRLKTSIRSAEDLIDKLISNNELPFYERDMKKNHYIWASFFHFCGIDYAEKPHPYI